MRHFSSPAPSSRLRPIQFRPLQVLLVSGALAALGGCESMYEGPTRTTSDRDRSGGYALQDRNRSAYDSRAETRYDGRATTAGADQQRVTVERTDRISSSAADRSGDRTRAASNTRSSGATRVQRDGDR